MSIDIKPLGYRLIVEKEELREKKVGLLYVPDTSKEMESTEGIVIATGEAVEHIKTGDIVSYGKYVGHNFERNGKKYVYLNEEDILGIIVLDNATHTSER